MHLNWPSTLLFVAAILTTSCATPTRTDADKFRSRSVGSISTDHTAAFGDCILDGFNPLQGTVFNQRSVKQQRRSTGIRIDILVAAGTILLVSVDVNNDGRIELFETTAMPLTSKETEYKVFTACQGKFGNVAGELQPATSN